MLNVGLNGNYQLNSTNVGIRLPRKSAGAYALGRTLNADGYMLVDYVGRADYDVNGRLKQHASEGKYKYFAFIYCEGVTAAHAKECELTPGL